jgi:regulator of sigma E protease
LSDLFLGLISFAFILIPLVIIHEFGHFIAAKSVGITVLEFGIGIPPRALTLFTHKGTEYTLNWIPLGGFVRPYGEDFMSPKDQEGLADDRQEIEERRIDNAKSVNEAGPWQRIWFMFAGPFFNFVTALVILIILGFVALPQRRVAVFEVAPNSAAEQAGLEENDIITHIDGQLITKFSEYNKALRNEKETYTFTIKRNGKSRDIEIAPSSEVSVSQRVVGIVGIVEDMPAEKAGLKPNDVILSVDDGTEKLEINNVDDLVDFTVEHEGVPIIFEIQRGSEVFTKTITPEKNQGVAQIGVQITEVETESKTGIVLFTARDFVPTNDAGRAVKYGVTEFGTIMKQIVIFPVEVARGIIPIEQARPVSIVGIGKIGAITIRNSQEVNNPYPVLQYAALLSIALAFTNLLPIPALDGGRIFFVFIELLRGKPIAPEREGFIHMVGFVCLLGLIVVFVFLDIFFPII